MNNNEKIIKKLMNLFNEFSNRELEYLKSMLESYESNRVIIKTITNILQLRHLRKSGDSVIDDNRISSINKSPHISHKIDVVDDRIEQYITAILNDRNLFPRTIDVIDAVNEGFLLNIDYSTYYKRGRRDLIHKVLSEIRKLPRNLAIKRINKLTQILENSFEYNESYKNLFKILTNNE